MATRSWIGTDAGNEGDWETAANWTGAAVPVNGDDVFIENGSEDIDTNLDQSAVVLGSLHIAQSFTGNIGTATVYLQIGSPLTNIGYHYGKGSPSGSSLIKLDLNDDAPTAGTINVYNTGASSDQNVATLRLLVNHANSILNMYKGDVGLAAITGETSTIATINVASVDRVASDANMFVGSGVTLTTLSATGGKTILNAAAAIANISNGTTTTNGTGTVVALTIDGGEFISNSSGTITLATITGGLLDMTKSVTARTVTTLKLDDPGTFTYDVGVITLTNDIQPAKTTGIITYRAS